MNKLFQKKIEDFQCENCENQVKGNGFTNHCPICLWSKHVDINPGDRASKCKGLMKPIEINKKGEKTIILHECIKCKHQKRNKISENDDFEEIIDLTKKQTEK